MLRIFTNHKTILLDYLRFRLGRWGYGFGWLVFWAFGLLLGW